jgi:hypothetical protein
VQGLCGCTAWTRLGSHLFALVLGAVLLDLWGLYGVVTMLWWRSRERFCVLERIHYYVCAPLYSGGAAMLESPHPISC